MPASLTADDRSNNSTRGQSLICLVVKLIDMNLTAQVNILAALTEANASFADCRRQVKQLNQSRGDQVLALTAAYDVYTDVLQKADEGLMFYSTLFSLVKTLNDAVEGIENAYEGERKSKEKEKRELEEKARELRMAREARETMDQFGVPPVASSGYESPVTLPPNSGAPSGGGRLKDYLAYYRSTIAGQASPRQQPPRINPPPVSSLTAYQQGMNGVPGPSLSPRSPYTVPSGSSTPYSQAQGYQSPNLPTFTSYNGMPPMQMQGGVSATSAAPFGSVVPMPTSSLPPHPIVPSQYPPSQVPPFAPPTQPSDISRFPPSHPSQSSPLPPYASQNPSQHHQMPSYTSVAGNMNGQPPVSAAHFPPPVAQNASAYHQNPTVNASGSLPMAQCQNQSVMPQMPYASAQGQSAHSGQMPYDPSLQHNAQSMSNAAVQNPNAFVDGRIAQNPVLGYQPGNAMPPQQPQSSGIAQNSVQPQVFQQPQQVPQGMGASVGPNQPAPQMTPQSSTYGGVPSSVHQPAMTQAPSTLTGSGCYPAQSGTFPPNQASCTFPPNQAPPQPHLMGAGNSSAGSQPAGNATQGTAPQNAQTNWNVPSSGATQATPQGMGSTANVSRIASGPPPPAAASNPSIMQPSTGAAPSSTPGAANGPPSAFTPVNQGSGQQPNLNPISSASGTNPSNISTTRFVAQSQPPFAPLSQSSSTAGVPSPWHQSLYNNAESLIYSNAPALNQSPSVRQSHTNSPQAVSLSSVPPSVPQPHTFMSQPAYTTPQSSAAHAMDLMSSPLGANLPAPILPSSHPTQQYHTGSVNPNSAANIPTANMPPIANMPPTANMPPITEQSPSGCTSQLSSCIQQPTQQSEIASQPLSQSSSTSLAPVLSTECSEVVGGEGLVTAEQSASGINSMAVQPVPRPAAAVAPIVQSSSGTSLASDVVLGMTSVTSLSYTSTTPAIYKPSHAAAVNGEVSSSADASGNAGDSHLQRILDPHTFTIGEADATRLEKRIIREQFRAEGTGAQLPPLNPSDPLNCLDAHFWMNK